MFVSFHVGGTPEYITIMETGYYFIDIFFTQIPIKLTHSSFQCEKLTKFMRALWFEEICVSSKEEMKIPCTTENRQRSNGSRIPG